MPQTDATSLSERVNALVKDGWHFKSTGTDFYAHHEDGAFFRCSKVGDVVTAIEEDAKAKQAAADKEATDTLGAMTPENVDPAISELIGQ